MNIIFRKIELNDIEFITNLRLQFLSEIIDEDLPKDLYKNIFNYLNKHISDGTCIGVVGENEDNKIIAKAILCIYETIPDQKTITGLSSKLFSVYTLPEYRSNGIMKELLENLIELAKSSNVTEIYLNAEEKAIPLYKKLGFNTEKNEMRLSLNK